MVKVLWSVDILSASDWRHVLINVEADRADFIFQGTLAAQKRSEPELN